MDEGINLNFRDFLEQGTPLNVTGLNAAGRAGQSVVTPDMGPMRQGNINPQGTSPLGQLPKTNAVIPPSPFNASNKFRTQVPRPFGNQNAGGVAPMQQPAPASPFTPGTRPGFTNRQQPGQLNQMGQQGNAPKAGQAMTPQQVQQLQQFQQMQQQAR